MIPVSLTFSLLQDGRKQATKYRRAGLDDRCIPDCFFPHRFAGLLVAGCTLPTHRKGKARKQARARAAELAGLERTDTNLTVCIYLPILGPGQ